MLKIKPPQEITGVPGMENEVFGASNEYPQPAQEFEASALAFPQ